MPRPKTPDRPCYIEKDVCYNCPGPKNCETIQSVKKYINNYERSPEATYPWINDENKLSKLLKQIGVNN